MRMPGDLGPFHIVGIGGIGMSAIAEVMLALGYLVQGSDQNDNGNVKRLREKGATVFVGHAPENIDGARYVVISSAVKPGNPELETALALGIPVIRRAEILAELMRLYSTISVTGTHGKTTTTSLTATLLVAGGIDPTVINGGIIHDWGSNARIGEGEWLVAEADESDGTFIKLPTRIGVVTNIDPEHLDYYGSFDAALSAFRTFFRNIPFYGLAVAGIDHPEVRTIVEEERANLTGRRLLTYGEAADADLRLENARPAGGAVRFDAALSAQVKGGARRLENLTLPVPGRYNALNALAAIAVACELGLSDEVIRVGLRSFGGVNRRFTLTGNWNGIPIYDDYAHHPVEIAEVLRAAKGAAKGRVIAVVQPHRYSRLKDLFDGFGSCFGDADIVAVAPVYAAGETPLEGIDHEALAEKIRRQGHGNTFSISGEDVLAPVISRTARPGDLVICLGAGSISKWAQNLPAALAGLQTNGVAI